MNDIRIFENKEVRSIWVEEKEKWFFSVVDIVEVLKESKDSGAYWRKLKQILNAEGSEVVTFCHALKLKSHKDGKMYKTDVADM